MEAAVQEGCGLVDNPIFLPQQTYIHPLSISKIINEWGHIIRGKSGALLLCHLVHFYFALDKYRKITSNLL
jgi:hypothetical protein